MSYGKKLYKSNLTAFDAENVYDSTIGKLQNEINAELNGALNSMHFYTDPSELGLTGTPTMKAIANAMPLSSIGMFRDSQIDMTDLDNASLVNIITIYKTLDVYRIFAIGARSYNQVTLAQSRMFYAARDQATGDWVGWRELGMKDAVVNKSGDTMTGDLILHNAPCTVKDTRITSGTTPSSDIYGRAYYLDDSKMFNIGTWQIMALTNGREGFQLVAGKKVNNVNKFNYIRMLVDANGDPVVEMSDPAAWRSALSINAINSIGAVGTGGLRIDFLNGKDQYYMPFYAGASENNKITLYDKNWNIVWKIPKDYKANDTFSITSSLVLNGLIGNTAKTTIYLDCVVDRSMENISTISVTAMAGYIVGTKGRDASGTTDYTGSGFTLSCTKQGNHHVRIGITKTSAFPMGDGFTPVTYFGTLTLKFT